MRLPRKNVVYDIAHKSTVIGLVGTMLYSMSVLAFKMYEISYITPPMKNEIINLVKEQEMRDAQALHERELMGHSK
ncbi:Hypothetical predicted protein [Mytilus galloprovincialis]|uniref:Uncharacterized protein n=1 Tax=Mytilus galloprovincialis TaxID=29158 RepID=A0A8B6E3G5_MYTGA|nr:Hypothetical predicted protein [Mytilus galloprovincialis]